MSILHVIFIHSVLKPMLLRDTLKKCQFVPYLHYLHSTCTMSILHVIFIHSVFKQALHASGANATARHTEEVSLCTLFLMEAAKKAEREFGLSQW